MKKIFGMIIFTCLLMSCSVEPSGTQVEVSQKETDSYEVRLLFEVDGVKVYRFYDDGHYIYFTNTSGQVKYEYTQMAGKTVITDEVNTMCNETDYEYEY